MASLQKNVASQKVTFGLVNASTGAALTSATFTSSAWVTVDGTQAGFGGSFTTLGNGQYQYAPTQAETNGTDIGIFIAPSGAVPVNLDFHTDQVDSNGFLKVDLVDIAGSTVSTSSAQLGVNVVNVNAVAASSVTTINANLGTTQPVNYTGTGASALVKSDMQDIAGSAVSTSTAQIGANLVNIAGSAVSTSTAQLGVNTVNIAGHAATLDANNLLEVDVVDIAGSAVSTSSAQIGVNAVNIGGHAAALDTNNFLKVDVEDIAGSAVSTSSAQLGVNLVNISGSSVSTSSAQLGVNAVNIGGQAASLDANNLLKVDVEDIGGSSTSGGNLSKTTANIGRGTCTTGGSTTSIPTSAFTPGGASIVSGQFIGRTIIFDGNTATGALQGQASNITANTSGSTPTFTVTALTTAPSSGDTFSVV